MEQLSQSFLLQVLEFLLGIRSQLKAENREWFQLAPLIDDHKLAGLFYVQCGDVLPSILKEDFQRSWKAQLYRNQVHQEILQELGREAAVWDKFVVPLKGVSFERNLYAKRKGERFQSDIDIYWPWSPEHINHILHSMGFQCRQKFGLGLSPHKSIFTLNHENFPVVVEVHQKLISTEPPDWQWKVAPSESLGIFNLRPEDEFLFLMHHLSYQHTFLKLYWLNDIYLFLNQYGRTMDWEEVFALARLLKRRRSLQVVLSLMSKYRSDTWMSSLSDQGLLAETMGIDEEFLWQPRKRWILYYWVKHRLKDSFIESLRYDWDWVREKYVKLSAEK